ncbi:hypothetical protein Trydic_g5647 [Trypoxylus dichotomus]
MPINQESHASRPLMSMLGEQRLPLGTKKLLWLPFWTLRAPLIGRPSCQCSWVGKDVESNQRLPAMVVVGCPQSGVLSPLLWCLLVDDLLFDLREAGFYSQGYVDDVTMMVSGMFNGVVSERMQAALRLVQIWCRREGWPENELSKLVLREELAEYKDFEKGDEIE